MLEVTSLAIFAFGALTFSTLALFYWGERHRGKRRPQTALPAFTLVCAVAFLSNLLYQTSIPQSAGPWLSVALQTIRSLALGLLPPLIFHLVLESGGNGLPAGRGWRWLLAAFYAASVAAALARVLQGSGLLNQPWSDNLYRAPAVALAAAAGMGLLFQVFSRHRLHQAHLAHGRWIRVLLVLMLVCATASLSDAGAWVDQIPDYLLLAFFCVSLYYRERLVFFDVLMKRGVFLALGLAALTAAIVAATRSLVRLPDGATPWLYGFIFFWLAGPWVYTQVARAIDRLWLRRPYSAVEAERQFIRDVQRAATEEELRARAGASLAAIFQAPAQIGFTGATAPHSGQEEEALCAEIEHAAACHGFILLAPRTDGIPFLSDDRRLLQSLAGTLGMVLENVRFRADRRRQEEREHQLRLLASRAELKALRAQINPHFLFNSLSVIAGLMQYQPDLADETIERLAQVFRYTLRKSENEWAPLGEEIEFITAYLRIEQARFGEHLQVELDVDPAAARIRIPAMSIQPLIENAIKHGVSAREGRGTVGLRAALENGRLSVEVFDTGPGFPPGFSLQVPGEGHGLRNVAERLRGYYGDSARLSWESGGDRTRVVLTLPQSAVAGVASGELC
ncbi:MAG: sensor histidine kinase [Bryobacteraceae bacterium]